jgi:hypothetical protein
MSALPPKGDIQGRGRNVRFVPIADISQVSFDDLVGAAKHQPIAKYIRSGIGLELQKTDSEIAEDVMLTMMKKDYLVLSIHDSFITYSGLGELLTEVMKNSYHTRMKADVGVDTDPTFLEHEIREQELPTDEEYPDLPDIIDNRLSEPEYNGYLQRLKHFLDSQTDEWHQRFQVYKIV